jgi:hypothetical protein
VRGLVYAQAMVSPSRSFVPASWALPESLARRLGASAGRQRLLVEEGHVLLVLHRAPTPDDDAVRTPALFWRTAEGHWQSSPEAGGLDALARHVQAYAQSAQALDARVEAATTPSDYFGVMRWVHPLLRSSRHMQAVLQAARDALPDERRILDLRDAAVEVERAVDLVAADARAGMEYTLARSSEAQARFAHEAALEARTLNRLVAFFFPLATLVAVFGMNPPESILGMRGFWPIVGGGALAGLGVLALVVTWRRAR